MADRAIGGKRVALVIGNSDYTHAPELKNPRNDATDIAAALRRLHFVVTLGIDLTREALLKTIADFARTTVEAEATLFYYAGHGLQVDGRNYLVPIDADIATQADVRFSAQRIDDILDMMVQSSRTSLIVLDACRNNPFTRSLKRSMMKAGRDITVGDGLATVQLAPGGEALIAYSTQPDNTAEDGEGQRNSPYTTALLRYLELRNVAVEGVLKRVGQAVKDVTHGQQIPWYNSSLFSEFQFNPSGEQGRIAKADTDQHPWLLLKDTPNPGLIQSFVRNFPGDRYVDEARQRLAELEAEAWHGIRLRQTFTEIESFLGQYPDGHYANEAKARLVALRRQAIGSLVVLGGLTGLISIFSASSSRFVFMTDVPVRIGGSDILLWFPAGIALFAGAVPFALSRWWPKPWRAMAVLAGMTILAWIVAHVLYQVMALGLGLSFDGLTKLRLPVLQDGTRPTFGSIQLLLLFVITAAASMIGAALTITGAASSPRLRAADVYTVTLVGAGLLVLPEVIAGALGFSEVVAVGVLFVTWQAWVAGCLAWAHARTWRIE